MNRSLLPMNTCRYSLTTGKTGRRHGWITLKSGSHQNLPVNSFPTKGSLKSIARKKQISGRYLKKSSTPSLRML